MNIEEENIKSVNIDRLLEGYQYGDLPEDYLLENYKNNIKSILNDLFEKTNLYNYKFDDNNLIDISKINNCESPTYIHQFGAEPISFLDFKKNGTYREIQIPNLIFYVPFMHNSIEVFEDIFDTIYDKDNNFTNYSNSYVVFDRQFRVKNEYDNSDIVIKQGEFATKNNKMVNQLNNKQRADKYFKSLGSKLYVLKMDIESFYPNIYTHFLERIKNYEPYKNLIDNNKKSYFEFLDKYNMKVNSNQTKGIMAGCFASNISSELMMLCVDNEIEKLLEGKDISYIRYVDDFTFFSNSKEELEKIMDLTQKTLNKYKLRINQSKTKIMESVLYNDFVDFKQIDFDFNHLGNIWETIEEVNHLKNILKNYLENNKLTECKILLTKIGRRILNLLNERKEVVFIEDDELFLKKENFLKNEDIDYIINYLLQIVFYSPVVGVSCYKLIEIILKYYQEADIDTKNIVDILYNKTSSIDDKYNDTIIQIWHYYILNKYSEHKYEEKLFEKLKEVNDDQGIDINPLVLLSFVKQGNGSNTKIIKYIKKTYEKYSTSEKKLGNGIMLSKWWIVLLLIHVKDKKNYYSFYESNAFSNIWKNLSKNDI